MIVAIVGPTGVGKTALSVMLAKRLGNTEIINCDSMQVYKELNIGVAKIKEEEKEGIGHHLFSIKSISEDYSVYDYQTDARALIKKFSDEGKNIIITGGTGLYLRALLFDYNFDDKKSTKQIIPCKIIGLTKDRASLYDSINKRVDSMIKEGLVSEVKDLYDRGINTRAVRSAIGYKELYEYFDGVLSLEDAIDKIKQASRRYAKRQYTFFNNQLDVKWFEVDFDNFNNTIKQVLEYISNKR